MSIANNQKFNSSVDKNRELVLKPAAEKNSVMNKDNAGTLRSVTSSTNFPTTMIPRKYLDNSHAFSGAVQNLRKSSI